MYSQEFIKFVTEHKEDMLKHLNARYSSLTKGNYQVDMADIYQDSCESLWKEIVSGEIIKIRTSLEKYFWGILNNKAKKIALSVTNSPFERFPEPQSPEISIDDTIVAGVISEDNNNLALQNLVRDMVRNLPSPCKELLIGKFWHGYNMQEMAEKMGYNSHRVAITQTSRCMTRFTTTLKNEKARLGI